jgi:hypothetical protein
VRSTGTHPPSLGLRQVPWTSTIGAITCVMLPSP